jgi:flavodoxin
MQSLVIYTTTSGNTRSIAEAIAEALSARGPTDLVSVDSAPADLAAADLVVVGGPTEGHGLTPPMTRFLDRVPDESWTGRAVATFDTRLRWPRLLSGSAAADIAKRLDAAGIRPIVPPESFIVTMKPELEPGERERAAQWAGEVARAVDAARQVTRA